MLTCGEILSPFFLFVLQKLTVSKHGKWSEGEGFTKGLVNGDCLRYVNQYVQEGHKHIVLSWNLWWLCRTQAAACIIGWVGGRY